MTVARRKSFVLAAEELRLTQPAVSRSVRELETILGHDLFDRSTRGAELTPRGRDFFDAAENSILQIWQGTNAVIGNLGLNEAVRIGALPNVCSQFLPPIVLAYKAEAPEVRVEIATGINRDLLAQLRRGETDFVLGRLSTGDDMRGLVFEALFDEALVFVVRKDHPVTLHQPSLADALGFPMLIPPAGTIIRQELDRFLSSQGVSDVGDRIETTSSDLQRTYLRLSDAIAVAPRGVFQNELETGEFVQLPIGQSGLSGPVGLTTNPDVQLSPAVRRFLSFIRGS